MWPSIVGALAVLISGGEPIPAPECVQEFAAREVAYGKCLRVVADDAEYNRCLAALGRRSKERPKVGVCYRELPSVCVRLLEDLHRRTVHCYKAPGADPEGAADDGDNADKQERVALSRAAMTCRRLLEDAPKGDRAVHACRRYAEKEKRRGKELLSALVPQPGMGSSADGDPRQAVVRCAPFSEPLRVVDKSLVRLCEVKGESAPDGLGPDDDSDQDPAVASAERGLEWLGTALKIIGVIALLVLGIVLWRRYGRMERAMAEPLREAAGGEPESNPTDNKRKTKRGGPG
ncbi:MAG: hypothetical protein ABIP48_17030 [Planctomycetota bacterium]